MSFADKFTWPVAVGLAVLFLGGVAELVWGVASKALSSFIGAVIPFLGQGITLPLYLLILLCIPPIVILGFIILVSLVRLKDEPANHKNSFLNYTEDMFYNMKWQWRYQKDGALIVQLVNFCPKDFTELTNGNQYAKCDTCGKKYYYPEDYPYIETLLPSVERYIRRNIRTGEWENVVTDSDSM